MKLWPHQEKGLAELDSLLSQGRNSICLTSPTGGGKSRMMVECIQRARMRGQSVSLYTHRKMLLKQTAEVLEKNGIKFGVRASGYTPDIDAEIQLCSIQTELARCVRAKSWTPHRGDIVLVDEAHLQATGSTCKFLEGLREKGGRLIGFTATPLGIGGLYSDLVVAGTNSELRACGAHVPAVTYGPDEPDTRDIRRQPSGEFCEDDVRRVIMTPVIFGRVYEWWKMLNPSQTPALLFAPGVGESQWFAEQFYKKGVSAAHIDGNSCWIDGRECRSDKSARDGIIDAFRNGIVKVLCNRFVLREGIDIPEIQHIIFATIFGGLQSYLQAGGRGLRGHHSKQVCTVQDHGGNWWRHGDLNEDRTWDMRITDRIATCLREERIRDGEQPEPIVCPKCRGYRESGDTCPYCGYRMTRRSRIVIQQDGQMCEMDTRAIRPRRVSQKASTQDIWLRCMHRCRNSGKTFNQARGLFFYENRYYPPTHLPGMPIDKLDWFSKIRDVPAHRVISKSVF